MDNKTSQYYSSHVKDAVELYNSAARSGVSKYFAEAFPAGSSVLDIGCGSGRDMAILGDAGYDVYGADASPEMCEEAVKRFPQLKGRVVTGELPADGLYFNRKFDCVLCSALLMHIRDDRIFDAAFTIRNNLNDGGRLLLSIPVERGDVGADSRVPDGRLFIMRTADYYTLLFERLGFKRIGYYEEADSLGRAGVKWGVMLFHLEAANGTRSIDKIEGILNREQKTATYKLALVRALTDIASTEYNSVKWYMDGFVGVPISNIAYKWILYYWPLFEYDKFIPQKTGEKIDSGKSIAFRKELTQLINKSKSSGGLSSFYNQYIDLNINDKSFKDIESLLRKIEKTIIKGPVEFAGIEEKIFDYNPEDKTVIVPADIWREMCLMWHWIGDALILRWGELTSRISKGEIKASEVIDLLIERADPERDTTVCRDLFSGVQTLECVWTGVSIDKRFDIDHVIPYSLWHNNDLWNLLPADPKVNNSKRDMLPTRGLLNKRKDIIKDYWNMIAKSYPARFDYEVKRFTGGSLISAALNEGNKGSHEVLFSAVAEAVEITAIQRGCGRWDG
jgi:SAM-dependent methyltransferase